MAHQTVIVLDFGGQYNQLIARRVRECGVYCEVKPYATPLEELRAMEPIGIIFVTGNPDFALEGYDLEAVSYVMKPVRRERLHAALSRARERMARRAAVLLPLSGGELERLYIADICCLESDQHCLEEGRNQACEQNGYPAAGTGAGELFGCLFQAS